VHVVPGEELRGEERLERRRRRGTHVGSAVVEVAQERG